MRRDPHALGIDRARWTLRSLLWQSPWLRLCSESGLCHLLKRLGLSYKRGRDWTHSPDPDYEPKLQEVAAIVAAARASSGEIIALFEDELTYYRQPTVTSAYEARGAEQPRARRSHQRNTATRIAAALNVQDGRTFYEQASHVDVAALVRLYQQIHQAYPLAKQIYVIQDNWPVHGHPDLRVALEPQASRWPIYRPPNWPTEPSAQAVKRWGSLALPIQVRPLPTYASWTNPIEKLWRWLRQEVLHLHRWADQLGELRAAVRRFLDRFAEGSLQLLRYVGLLVPT